MFNDEIRIGKHGILLGKRTIKDQKPVALIKRDKVYDTMSLDQFASELYGLPVHCEVQPAEAANNEDHTK